MPDSKPGANCAMFARYARDENFPGPLGIRKGFPLLVVASFLAALLDVRLCSQTTAVSNLGQTPGLGVTVGKQTSPGPWNFSEAFSFSTGASAATFSGVTLLLNVSTGTGFSLSLYTGISASGPSGLLATLSGSTVPVAGNNIYTSAATALLANSTYWLVAAAPTTAADTSFNLSSTSSFAEDGGALSGWTIGDVRWLTNDGGTTWFTASDIPQFSVQASAVPESSTFAALAGLSVLLLAAFRRR